MTTKDQTVETSAACVDADAVLAAPDDTAGDLRRRLRQAERSDWDLVCIVQRDNRLLGTLSAQQLAVLPDDGVLGSCMRVDGPRVSPDLDQERMASHALERGVAAMPVVDPHGALVGVVGARSLMEILRREHVEDLHRLAGIARENDRAREAVESPPLRRARHRLPWLLVGLAGSALATWVIAGFESALAAKPALAFFVPGLVYLADAIGTQSEAVAVRGLSLSHAPFARLAGGELRTGLLIGTVLGLLAFPMVWAVFGDRDLALAVALALACASMSAAVLGLSLPWLLGRLRLDPAYGSGPLATIVQDVLSLVIYFGLVTALVV